MSTAGAVLRGLGPCEMANTKVQYALAHANMQFTGKLECVCHHLGGGTRRHAVHRHMGVLVPPFGGLQARAAPAT